MFRGDWSDFYDTHTVELTERGVSHSIKTFEITNREIDNRSFQFILPEWNLTRNKLSSFYTMELGTLHYLLPLLWGNFVNFQGILPLSLWMLELMVKQ